MVKPFCCTLGHVDITMSYKATVIIIICIIIFTLTLRTVGTLCEYTETTLSTALRQSCDSYDSYIASLEFTCLNGTHGQLTWTPDETTPDLVYYQVRSKLVTSINSLWHCPALQKLRNLILYSISMSRLKLIELIMTFFFFCT